MVIIMTFDKFLNRSISILLSCVMVVFITIITLLVTPVWVHADDSFITIDSTDAGISSSVSNDLITITSDASASSVGNGIYFHFPTATSSVSFDVDFSVTAFSSSFNIFGSTSTNTPINASNLVNCTTSSSNGIRASAQTGSFSVNLTNYLNTSGRFFFFVYGPNNTGLFNISNLYIDGVPVETPVSSFARTITIKPGYVAYIQTDGGTLDLVAQFHEYSRFSRPLWDNGVRISFNGGLVPTSGTVFNDSFGSSVDWLKVASAPSNLLGQTMTGGRSYSAGLPEAGSNKCVVIYNPAYGNANSLVGSGTIDLGVYISATFSNVIDVTQYKLRADASVTYTSGAAISSGSPDNYDLAYSYIPSENDPSDVVSDSDYRLLDLSDNTSGPAIDMNAGGYNGTSDYENDNPEEAENGILGLLSRIFKFLSAPVSHIMSLFNAGGNFMSWLGQLWVWLPSDVGAILVDALIVLIVIGAIKFLWK